MNESDWLPVRNRVFREFATEETRPLIGWNSNLRRIQPVLRGGLSEDFEPIEPIDPIERIFLSSACASRSARKLQRLRPSPSLSEADEQASYRKFGLYETFLHPPRCGLTCPWHVHHSIPEMGQWGAAWRTRQCWGRDVHTSLPRATGSALDHIFLHLAQDDMASIAASPPDIPVKIGRSSGPSPILGHRLR